ncbi:MAG TPA: tetratricopeptide repeat protein [Anaerolineaceae bacterium]|nr:tetratricopeptide repeat protein [Anaerolineaceae bacterium]
MLIKLISILSDINPIQCKKSAILFAFFYQGMTSLEMSTSETPEKIQKSHVRQALKSWDSIQTLGENPLSRLDTVQTQRRVSGYSDTLPGYGLALREILNEIIESLKPEKTEPDYREKMWRPYIILSEQFLHGRSPDFLAEQLFISRRTFYNEQEAALDMVVSDLIQREEEKGSTSAYGMPLPLSDIPVPLTWLQTPFMAPPRPNNPMIGRETIIQKLKSTLLHNAIGHDIVLQGLPGVGKTALAIELAHDSEILARFKDGVLWVGLGCQPDPLMLLGFWASILGIPNEEIARQSTLNQRAQLVKTVIGTRHMLLIVDDVWTVETANLFRLGGPNCACIFTTRLTKIASEFAPEAVAQIPELGTEEGIRLLSTLAPLAVQPKKDEMAALVEAVGGLPLALTLMGRHLRQQGAQSRRLQNSLEQLKETQNRLQLSQPLSPLGQSAASVESTTPVTLQAILDVSYVSLPQKAQQALHTLALFPSKPGSFSDEAAMAVLEENIEDLDTLVDYGLLENVGVDRYSMHQVIADFAGLKYPPEPQIKAFFQYWVRWLDVHQTDYPQIDLETHTIRRALQLTQQFADHQYLVMIILKFRQFLVVRGLYDECLYWIEQAFNHNQNLINTEAGGYLLLSKAAISGLRGQLDAAEGMISQTLEMAGKNENPLLRAEALQGFADIHLQRGEYFEARNQYTEALSIFQLQDMIRGQAQCLRSMGVTYAEQGDYTQASNCYERALDLFRKSEDERGESSVLISMGGMLADQGCYGKAREQYKQALVLKQKCHDLRGEGVLLNNLGIAALAQCQYDAARDYFTRSLAIRKEIGDLRGTGIVLGNLGVTMDRLGEYAQAKTCFDNALVIYRQIGARSLEGRELSFLGLLLHHMGDQHAACERCEQSLKLAEEAGSRLVQGNALTYLGHALVELESLPEAVEAYQRALVLRNQSNQLQLSVDAWAGMARVALMQHDLQSARQYMEEIWQKFQQDPLTGADEPLRAYITCYQVAKALRDDQAEVILHQAIDLFQTQAREITDAHLHRTFVENVPAHRFLRNMTAD